MIWRKFPYTNFHEMNMDQLITVVKVMVEEWVDYEVKLDKLYTDISTAFEDFQAEFDRFIASIDVPAQFTDALNRLIASGQFLDIVRPVIVETTQGVAETWLSQHITQPTTPVVDDTLTIAGAAADSAATGAAIGSARISIKNNASFETEEPVNILWEQGGYNATTGVKVNTENYIRSKNSIIIDNIDTIKITNNGDRNQGLSILRFDNFTNTYLGRVRDGEILTAPGYSRNIDVSNLTGYVIFSWKWSPTRAIAPSEGVYLPIATTTTAGHHIAELDRELDYTKEQLTITEQTNRIDVETEWTQGSVNTTSMYDDVNSLTQYAKCGIIPVEAVDEIIVGTERTESYFVYCRCYDAEGAQISSTSKTITSTNILNFDVTEAHFVRLIIKRTTGTEDLDPTVGEDFFINYRNQIVNKVEVDFVKDNLLASFKRFAVIGDSLSAGHIYPDPESTAGNYDDKSIAWGTFITRKLYNTYYNFSRSGMSADQFVTGVHAGGGDLGDNKLSIALDGNHDVPAYIINMGINNPNGLVLGTTADISLTNPENNANSIIGWYARLVQEISMYYRDKSQPVHIFLNVYGFMPAGGTEVEERLRSAGRLMTWTKQIYDFLKSNIESHGNFLHFINLYSDYPETSRDKMFLYNGAVIQKHWTSVSYNAIGNEILYAINDYIWNNPEVFDRIEFISSNTYIDHYNNPSNFT